MPKHSLENEAAVIALAKSGDTASWKTLYEFYGPSIKRYVRYQGVSEETADDILQQTFLKAWQSLGGFVMQEHGISAWLYRIAKNCLIDFFRKQKPVQSLDVALEKGEEPSAMPSYEFNDRLQEALSHLGTDDALLVFLRYAEDWNHEEIAAKFGITPVAARKRLSRCLASLRLRLKDTL